MNSGYNTKFAKKSQEKADDVYSKVGNIIINLI